MLEVSHISKTFNAGTVNEKRALSDLSLRLADGEFATIVSFRFRPCGQNYGISLPTSPSF